MGARFNFMQLLGLFYQNRRFVLPGGLAPPLGEILDPSLYFAIVYSRIIGLHMLIVELSALNVSF